MSTARELTEKWAERLADWRALGVRVDGEKVALEILDDLRKMTEEDHVTLKEASLLGGYSVDHLQRLLAAKSIENVGRKNAPRLRRSDVPTKPGRSNAAPLPAGVRGDQLSARRRIVADAQARTGA